MDLVELKVFFWVRVQGKCFPHVSNGPGGVESSCLHPCYSAPYVFLMDLVELKELLSGSEDSLFSWFLMDLVELKVQAL